MGRTMAGAQSLEELVEQFVVSVQLCLRSRTVLVALLPAVSSAQMYGRVRKPARCEPLSTDSLLGGSASCLPNAGRL